MKIRKRLAYILCLALCAAYAAPGALGVYAENEQISEDVILYSNDFENGLNESYNRLGKDGVSKVDTYDLGGEYGKVMRFYGSASNTVTDYRQVRFDFNKSMNSGDVFVISYDLICGQTGNYPFTLYTSKSDSKNIVSTDQYVTVVNSNVAAAYGTYGYYKTADKNTPPAWTPVKLADVSANVPMHIDVMTEMTDGGRNYTFLVDGEIKGRWSNTYNCAVPAVFMSNTVYADKESVYYVDNLVIKQLAKPKAEAAVSGTMGGDTVEITLSDSFGENVLANVKKDNVAIKNRFGESVEIKSVTASGNRLIIKPQNPFEYDENYTVDLSAVTDIYGRTAPNTEFSSQSEVDDEGNIVLRIKNAKAILYDGTEVNLNGEISPEVCGFEFELNARISEWSGGITLNGEPLDLSYDDSRKTLVSKSDGVLIGDGKYIIKTNDKIKNADGVSIRQYENSFVTSRGGIRVADLNWYNRDGAKIEPNTLGANENAKLVMTALNTSGQDGKTVFGYNSVGGERLNGFGFDEINISSGEILNKEVEYTPADSDERVIGFAADDTEKLNLIISAILVDKDMTKADSDERCSVEIGGYKNVSSVIVRVLNKDGNAVFQDIFMPNENGNVNIGFSTGKVSGLYNIYVSGADGKGSVCIPYTYTNPSRNADAIQWLNGLSIVPTAAEFESRANDLGFHNDLYGECSEKFINYVYSMSKMGEFKNADSKTTAGKLNKAAIIAAVESGTAVDIFDYSDELLLGESAASEFLNRNFVNATFKAEVNKRMNKSGFDDKTSANKYFDERFADAFILATVKYSDGTGNISDVIRKLADKAVIDPDKLSQKVMNAIDGRNFDTLTELKAAIDSAYTGGSNSGGSSGLGGSGGGSGSGLKGSVTIDTSAIDDITPTPTPNERIEYTDIDNVPWAVDAIMSLTEKGVVSGTGDGKFNPNANVLREEFTKMAVLAFADKTNAAASGFSDVDKNMWYAEYIDIAAETGIINGIGNNMFGIGEDIKRMDMAVVIYNAALIGGVEFNTDSEKFVDDSDIADYAKTAVYALKSIGVINGKDGGKFEPNASATRAEAAKIIEALLKIKG